jgi:3-oxoacyl-[acyl-carrier protein] reductase
MSSLPGGTRRVAVNCDVSNSDQVAAMVDQTLEAFGTVSILVNNAGILYRTPVESISEEEWNQVMAVNVNGVFLCSQAVIAPMKEQGWGRIVNLSSSVGKTVSALGGVHYTASKHAVLGITRGFARELAAYGITAGDETEIVVPIMYDSAQGVNGEMLAVGWDSVPGSDGG